METLRESWVLEHDAWEASRVESDPLLAIQAERGQAAPEPLEWEAIWQLYDELVERSPYLQD